MSSASPSPTTKQTFTFQDTRKRVITLDRETGYLLLSAGTIAKPGIAGLKVPETFTVEGHNFVAKDELHITLVGREVGTTAFGPDKLDLEKNLAKLFSRHSFDFALSHEGLKMISDGDRRSIIAHVTWPKALLFYSELSATFLGSESIVMPPHHITLMVAAHGGGRGIGVPTFQRLAELSPVRLPSLK